MRGRCGAEPTCQNCWLEVRVEGWCRAIRSHLCPFPSGEKHVFSLLRNPGIGASNNQQISGFSFQKRVKPNSQCCDLMARRRGRANVSEEGSKWINKWMSCGLSAMFAQTHPSMTGWTDAAHPQTVFRSELLLSQVASSEFVSVASEVRTEPTASLFSCGPRTDDF